MCAIPPFPHSPIPPIPHSPLLTQALQSGYAQPLPIERACMRPRHPESRNIAADEKIATDPVSTNDSQKSPGGPGSKSKGVMPGTAMDSAWNLRVIRVKEPGSG
jgi:hypothetical protein